MIGIKDLPFNLVVNFNCHKYIRLSLHLAISYHRFVSAFIYSPESYSIKFELYQVANIYSEEYICIDKKPISNDFTINFSSVFRYLQICSSKNFNF